MKTVAATTRLHIHGAWWIRDEDLGDAVTRTNHSFQRLAEVAPSWRLWYLPHDRLSKVGQPEQVLSNHPALIRRQFLASQEPTVEGPADLDLGYWLSASSEPENGRGLERSHFQVGCCKRSKYAGYNGLSIELPTDALGPDLYNAQLLCRAIDILADIWDPDWLIALDLLVRLTPEPWVPGPVLGWINYLSPRVATVENDLPPQWLWYPKSIRKRIFVHCAGRLDPSKPGHVSAVNAMFRKIRWSEPPGGVQRQDF